MSELNVRITASTAALQSGMSLAQGVVQAALDRMRSMFARSRADSAAAVGGIAEDAGKAGGGFGMLAGRIGAAAAAYVSLGAIKSLADMSDKAALAQARMVQVTGGLKQAGEASAALYGIAQRMQAPFAEVQAMFTRMLPAVQEMKGGVREATALSEILISTAKLGGASAAEAAAGAQQFAQALGSGVLQGDELKSILENNQVLARELARALGVSIGELRRLGSEGKLTSDKVAQALLGRYDEIRSQTAQLPQTVGGALTQVANAAQRLWASMSEGDGPMSFVVRALGEIVRVIDLLIARFRLSGKESQESGDLMQRAAQMMGKAFAYVVDVAEAVIGRIKAIGGMIGALFAAAGAAASGNLAGAAEVIGEAWRKELASVGVGFDALMGKGKALQAYTALLSGDGAASNEGRNRAPTPFARLQSNVKPKTPEGDGRMSQWQAALAEQKLLIAERARLDGTFRQMSVAEELAYWQRLLKRTDLSEKERIELRKRAADLGLRIDRDAFDQRIESLQAESAAAEKNYRARIDIAEEVARITAKKFGADSKEAISARAKVAEEERGRVAQVRELAELTSQARRDATLADIELDKMAADERLATGQMSQAQMFAMEREFAARRKAAELQDLQERLAARDPMTDPVAYGQVLLQIEAVKQAHEQRMRGIAVSENKEAASAVLAVWQDIGQRASSLWDQGVQAMIRGTLTWKGAMQAVGNELVQILSGVAKKQVTLWIAAEQQKTGATLMGTAQRWLAESAASAKSIALWAMTAVKNIMTSAWEAMAAAWKAVVGIPYVGPVLAPVAAGAAFAGVAAIAKRVASAEGGYDIPAGTNPMTQLHAREMVLPAKHADVIRSMADGGGAGSAQPREVRLEVKGASAGEFFLVNRQALLKVLNEAMRDNAWAPAR